MTAERYTAVFTGLLTLKKPCEYPYLTMQDESLGAGTRGMHRGRPPYEKMGREIPFEDLPEACRRLVLDAYRELWGL